MPLKTHLMKNIVLLLFCLLSGFYCAQLNPELHTVSQVDFEIDRATALSKINPKKSIELSNETYRVSKKIGYKNGILNSISILMPKYFDEGNHKKVIQLSKEGENLALEVKNYVILSNVYRLRASSYTALGFNNESIGEFTKALQIADKIESENKKKYLKAMIYVGIGTYSENVDAPLDSIIYYQKKSLETAEKITDSKDFKSKKYHVLALSYINLGMSSIALNRIKDAENYFSKALETCQNKDYSVSKDLEVVTLNEYAWLYYNQEKYDKAIDYAGKAEQLEKRVNMPYIRKGIYEVYFKSYVELGEKASSKKYMKLYTNLRDSLANQEKKTVNTPVNLIMDKHKQTHKWDVQILASVFSFVIILVFIDVLFWKRNQKKFQERYKLLIKNLEKTNSIVEEDIQQEVLSDKSINITDETVKMILVKLEKFEKSQKFIKKDLSLTSLANDMNTNTRYLSEIIKQYKESNYNNYINGLRIQYIINVLYENPIYREYKISYLAEVCGFSSREVFAVIFKKETGVSPSYFISNLKKNT